MSPAYLNEMTHISMNLQCAAGTTFPKELPLLLFVETENKQNPEWRELHQRQTASVADATVSALPGAHYLHHTQAGEIADGFGDWAMGW